MPAPSSATPPMIWMAVRYCLMAPEIALTPIAAAERDQPVPQHDAEPRRHASEETALDGPLNSEQVHGTEGHCQQQAHDHADGYYQGVGYELHGGSASPAPERRLRPDEAG